MRDEGDISRQGYEWLAFRFAQANSQLLTELGLLIQEHGFIPKEEYTLSVRETLVSKKNAVREAWEKEIIAGSTGEKLIFEIDSQIQTLPSEADLSRTPADILRRVARTEKRQYLERNCGICLSGIIIGDETQKCRCGTIFHKTCLEGIDRCPVCIAVLENDPPQDDYTNL